MHSVFIKAAIGKVGKVKSVNKPSGPAEQGLSQSLGSD